MTKNQREFQKQLARLERSIARLTKQHQFIQSAELPKQPKRVTRQRIKQLEELKGRHFVSEIDIETGEVIHESTYQDIYRRKPRSRSFYKREYDAEKARAYREAHREQIAEANKRYREKHKDEIRERQRAYRQSHKEEVNAKARAYHEANKQRINASARRRRRQKKLENDFRPAPPTSAFNVYDELITRFEIAKGDVVEPYAMQKYDALDTLIGILMSNREAMGEGDYTAYLKKSEDRIAYYIDKLIHASTQDQVQSFLSELVDILNATGMVISTQQLENISTLTEGGW